MKFIPRLSWNQSSFFGVQHIYGFAQHESLQSLRLHWYSCSFPHFWFHFSSIFWDDRFKQKKEGQRILIVNNKSSFIASTGKHDSLTLNRTTGNFSPLTYNKTRWFLLPSTFPQSFVLCLQFHRFNLWKSGSINKQIWWKNAKTFFFQQVKFEFMQIFTTFSNLHFAVFTRFWRFGNS